MKAALLVALVVALVLPKHAWSLQRARPDAQLNGDVPRSAPASSPPHVRAWAFARLGPVQTSLPGSPIFGSVEVGVSASYGMFVGMLRASDNAYVGFRDNPPPGE